MALTQGEGNTAVLSVDGSDVTGMHLAEQAHCEAARCVLCGQVLQQGYLSDLSQKDVDAQDGMPRY